MNVFCFNFNHRFSDAVEAKALKSQEKYYILRPETIESYFIMWRLTHDQKYRDWGWDAVQVSLERCQKLHNVVNEKCFCAGIRAALSN